MTSELRILIIEDDFRVAEINRELIEQVEGFRVEAIAKTGDEAIALLQNSSRLPDLILLDIFIPDRTGLELFWEIRRDFHQVDIIMLSAAKDAATIDEILRGGVFDYMIKPVDFVRFEQSLRRYRAQKALIDANKELEQTDIDRLMGIKSAAASLIRADSETALPKGIDHLTLDGVMEVLNSSADFGVNAMAVGKVVGVSRSTARRYLEHLVAVGKAKAQLNYGEIGRPERRYIPWTK